MFSGVSRSAAKVTIRESATARHVHTRVPRACQNSIARHVLVPYACSLELVELPVPRGTTLTRARALNAIYHARLVRVQEEISVHPVHRSGDWRQENVDQSVHKISLRGVVAVVVAIITARTAAMLDPSTVRLVHRTFHWRVDFVSSALAPSITSLGRELAVLAMTRAGLVLGQAQQVVLRVHIPFN